MVNSSFFTDGPTNTGEVVAPAAPASFYADPAAAASSATEASASALAAATSAAAAAASAASAASVTIGKADINSPAFTGIPTAPTPSNGDSSTRLATTAWVLANAAGSAPATAAPLMDSTAAVGVATKYAREDHVHPSDTSRASVAYVNAQVAPLAAVTYVDAQDATKAPLASPVFTGTPTAPTAAVGTNTTQLATTAFVLANAPAPSVFIPQNFLAGLGLANNGVDAVNDIDISPGVAADTTNAALMRLSAAMTKQLDVSWAVGTNAGGRLSAAAIANGTYHVWLIQRSDTGVVDVGFDVSPSSPTMPTNYDRKRRIGSIVRTAGVIKPFIQDGNTVQWTTAVADLSGASSYGTARVSQTITIPSGIRVQAFGTMHLNVNANTGIVLTDLAATDRDPATASGMMMFALSGNANAGQWSAFSNASAQVGVRVSSTGASIFVTLATAGYIDTRGQ